MGEAEPGSNAAEGSAADGDSGGGSSSGSGEGSGCGGGGGEEPMDLSVGGARRRRGRQVPALIPLAAVRRVQRHQRQLAAATAAADPRALLYSQLLHHFHAQELLRRHIALHAARMFQTAQEASSAIHGGAEAADMATDVADQCSAESEARRRKRPLTGKHVRHGTGASPATLLTLRRKIEARQRRHALPAASAL